MKSLTLVHRIQMPGDIQPLDRHSSQKTIEIRRDCRAVQAKPFRGCTNEDASNQFRKQWSIPAAEKLQLVPEQIFASGQRHKSLVRAAMPRYFLTAEDSNRIRITEHAQNDFRIA